VIEWDPRGFGFAQTDDGRRVYVHHSAFGSGNLSIGERLSMVVSPDQRNPGKLMTQNVARDGGHAADQQLAQLPVQVARAPLVRTVPPFVQAAPRPLLQAAPLRPLPPVVPKIVASPTCPAEEWEGGTVTEWYDERGYGFIELDDGRRLYVHHSAFGGGSMLQGLRCEAMAMPDKINKGKWSAASVRGDAVMYRKPGDELPPQTKRQRVE